jgi:hypothetical protein
MADEKERGQSMVLELFEEGKRFTEELLKENENLRMLIAKLKTEKRDLESKYIKVDVPWMKQKIDLLEDEVRQLKEENQELRDQFTFVEEENREFAERYVQVEKQNSDLISLYVASYRLHSTLNYLEVIGTLKEIVINLVGAERFGVYFLENGEGKLSLITHEGLENIENGTVTIGNGPVGEVAASGDVFVTEPDTDLHDMDADRPIACIPMKVGDDVLGVVAIYTLLVQKEGFQTLDYELFEMLGNHAATAVYGAKLYTLSERKRSTLQGFLNMIKTDGVEAEEQTSSGEPL